MVPFSDFVIALFRSGQLKLSSPEAIAPDDRARAMVALNESEKIYRNEFPHAPPKYDTNAALAASWAAEAFFRASQFTVYREISADQVMGSFAELHAQRKFNAEDPSSHYGVDLVFRFLPDLLGFANSANREDPVCAAIRKWAIEWPLSSVGMELQGGLLETTLQELSADGLTPGGNDSGDTPDPSQKDSSAQPPVAEVETAALEFNISALIQNDSLWQTYIDRILRTQDESRTHDPRVVEKIRQSIGLHHTLAGRLKELLETE